MRQFTEIETIRRALGIRQNVLAQRAGMKAQDYSRLKKPSKHGPTARTLTRLSKALDELVLQKGRDHGQHS